VRKKKRKEKKKEKESDKGFDLSRSSYAKALRKS